MPYKIIGVEVVASCDAVTTVPGAMRPLPGVVSDELAAQLSDSIKLQDVIHEARQHAAFSGDLTPAAVQARSAVVKLLNKYLTDPAVKAVDLDGVASSYRPNSTGGHDVVSWLEKTDASGVDGYWKFSLQIQGEVITGYAGVAITLHDPAAHTTSMHTTADPV